MISCSMLIFYVTELTYNDLTRAPMELIQYISHAKAQVWSLCSLIESFRSVSIKKRKDLEMKASLAIILGLVTVSILGMVTSLIFPLYT